MNFLSDLLAGFRPVPTGRCGTPCPDCKCKGPNLIRQFELYCEENPGALECKIYED